MLRRQGVDCQELLPLGEMRGLETIATALTAAETGHLVIATVHVPNALQTVERIVGVFPATQQNQIIAQLTPPKGLPEAGCPGCAGRQTWETDRAWIVA